VTIRYFADVRQLAGCSEEQWTNAAPVLRDLLTGLVALHGAAFAQRMFHGQQLNPEISFFVNGRDVVHLKGIDTPLHSDDVIAIFPPVAGG
jgi:sulfur-carrier protein